MGRRSKTFDALIIGGGLSSLFTGVINPSYIKLILSNLDLKVLSLGSLIAAGLPFLTGMVLENRRIYQRLYALLPAVMAVEAVLTILSAALYRVDAAAYYLTAMIVFGLFSSTVMHLLQELKQRRYRRGRAIFERRASMADALGYLVGSLLVFTDALVIDSVQVVLLLGFLQTALVYLLYLKAYRYRRARPLAPARRARGDGRRRSAPWPAAARAARLQGARRGGLEGRRRSAAEDLECPVPVG